MAKYEVRKSNPYAGNQISPSEPCFVIRGTDLYAPSIVRKYLDLLADADAPEEFLVAITEHLDRIIAWQYLNIEKVKFPD